MAQAMEQEFNALWRTVHEQDLPEEGREDRMLLFVAIARGMMKHLQENVSEGITVTVNLATYGEIPGTVTINTR